MRPLAEQDKAMFCALYTDAKTMRYIEPVYSQEKAINAFKGLVKRNSNNNSGFTTWAIFTKGSIQSNKSETYETNNEQLKSTSIGLVMLL